MVLAAIHWRIRAVKPMSVTMIQRRPGGICSRRAGRRREKTPPERKLGVTVIPPSLDGKQAVFKPGHFLAPPPLAGMEKQLSTAPMGEIGYYSYPGSRRQGRPTGSYVRRRAEAVFIR